MLTMTTVSDTRTLIDDQGNAYLVLGADGETDSLSPLTASAGPEKLQEILDGDAAALVLVIVADPVTGLGNALETERSLESACAIWASSTDALIKGWRRARRRVRIVNRACLSGDQSGHAALESVGLTGAAAKLRLSHPTPIAPSPLSLLCAAAMIQADPALQRLARELEAATIGADSKVDLRAATADAWLAASQQEEILSSLRVKAEHATTLEQRLAAATHQVSALEQGLAQTTSTLKEQATLHEKTIEKLTASEKELELLRETVRLQSCTLKDAMARQPQLDNLTSQVKKHEVAAIALQQRLARANEELRSVHVRRESLENELEGLRHQARFAKISDNEGYAGVLRSLPLVAPKRTGDAIRYPRPDGFIPSDVQIRDDWTDSLQVGEGGERIGREIVSRRKSGHVFFGPYATLPAGSYATDVQIILRSGVFKSDGYCLEVVSGDEVIASSRLKLARGHNRFLMPFRISTGRTVSELEVRLFSPGASDIALTKLRLLESASISPAAEQIAAPSAQTEDLDATLRLQGTEAQASR